jgi:predicted nucleic acid-binding protein
MGPVKYLLDSVIVIDHFNGIPEAGAFLARHGEECAVSVITRAEVLSGLDGGPRKTAAMLLDRYQTIVIDKNTADLAADLRREMRWKLPDAFQAAMARIHGLKLVTRNTRDFTPQRHNFVIVPYRA